MVQRQSHWHCLWQGWHGMPPGGMRTGLRRWWPHSCPQVWLLDGWWLSWALELALVLCPAIGMHLGLALPGLTALLSP